jgi:hypothetical protein
MKINNKDIALASMSSTDNRLLILSEGRRVQLSTLFQDYEGEKPTGRIHGGFIGGRYAYI